MKRVMTRLCLLLVISTVVGCSGASKQPTDTSETFYEFTGDSVAPTSADERPPVTQPNDQLPNDQLPNDQLNDPFEGFNRTLLSFNFWLDDWLFDPASRAYHVVTPQSIRSGVKNFGSNLGEPSTALNSVLQLDFKNAGMAVGRFALNTTVGVLGFFDPATHLNLMSRREDFGQTFSHWGVAPGPYIVLPVFGPATLRGAVGMPVDIVTDPLSHSSISSLQTYRVVASGLELLDIRRELDPQIQFARTSIDPYTVVKTFWWQSRLDAIANKDDHYQSEALFGTQQPSNTAPEDLPAEFDELDAFDEFEEPDVFDEFDALDDETTKLDP